MKIDVLYLYFQIIVLIDIPYSLALEKLMFKCNE